MKQEEKQPLGWQIGSMVGNVIIFLGGLLAVLLIMWAIKVVVNKIW